MPKVSEEIFLPSDRGANIFRHGVIAPDQIAPVNML